jgi:hypothetical protein
VSASLVTASWTLAVGFPVYDAICAVVVLRPAQMTTAYAASFLGSSDRNQTGLKVSGPNANRDSDDDIQNHDERRIEKTQITR